MKSSGILVVGSANMDLVVRCERLPYPGETLLGSDFQTIPGGKGANQAVAIAKLGGDVSFLGKLGHDAFGHELHNSLIGCGVRTDLVSFTREAPSGIAAITVDGSGQNTIVVSPGANSLVRATDVERAASGFSVHLAQLEVPTSCLQPLGKEALFILNPAPARALPNDLIRRVEILTPNEQELQLLTGIEPSNSSRLERAADRLLARGVKEVVVTLGPGGCFWKNAEASLRIEGRSVKAVDATAAGDCFNGALALFLYQGRPIELAIRLANAAAAISTTRSGAQPSMPISAELEQFAPELFF